MTNKDKLKVAKNFVVYYGSGNTSELAKFDLVIVEPSLQNEDTVKAVNASGGIILAYVSVMEVAEYYPNYKLFKEEDFLIVKGERIYNEEYKTSLIDLTSERCRSILIHHIGNLILNGQYDGVFLDTIADIEYEIIPMDYKNRLINAAIKLILEIKNLFSDIIIIQNNGLDILYKFTAKLIDGICWENPDLSRPIVNKLINLKDVEGLKVLMLSEKEKENSEKRVEELSRENNFIMYKASRNYLNIGKTPTLKLNSE